MENFELPYDLTGYPIHMVGIKGTGMTALAELLVKRGAVVTGSDVPDHFYTDDVLKQLPLSYVETFDPGNIPADAALVIHSAAYRSETNPELAEAVRRGIPTVLYTEALGAFSRLSDSSGISGVHGKTTTTALAGTLIKAVGLEASVLVGSAVSNFDGRCTLSLGNRFFVAETCEYQRNFLAFSPNRIVITAIESDHQDYYPTYPDILSAFVQYAMKLPEFGELIYCADDPGAAEAAKMVSIQRPDIVFSPYGRTASGDYRLKSLAVEGGRSVFRLEGFRTDFELKVPGEHLVLDAIAAIALVSSLVRKDRGILSDADIASFRAALSGFKGSKRRSEILGEAGGILFMDDYGHHPTAVAKTLQGLREFHPDRRIVIDFMSHTYSRTEALFEEFARCFGDADLVILHKIYPSARESYSGGVTGKSLYERARIFHPGVSYFEEPMDAFDSCLEILKPGDLFITMGAGDNWKLGAALYARLSGKDPK